MMHHRLLLAIAWLLCSTGYAFCAPVPAAKPAAGASAKPPAPGLSGPVGPRGAPKRVKSLMITKPGVYENYLIDAEWADQDAVRIKANNVILRNCEIRNGRRDAIEVYASDVLIENCKIHHFLAGTFSEQKDAHGITGQPKRLTIRNCEIGYVSGDCLQFDPDRNAWGDVVVENCRLYAATLTENAAGFKKGESPGENAVDTKQRIKNGRSNMIIRNCLIQGFAKNGYIGNRAALNLKNHIEAVVENCIFENNEICLRLRGPKGSGDVGGAWVTVTDCKFLKSDVAIRTENGIENLKVLRPSFGEGMRQNAKFVGGKPKGIVMAGEIMLGK